MAEASRFGHAKIPQLSRQHQSYNCDTREGCLLYEYRRVSYPRTSTFFIPQTCQYRSYEHCRELADCCTTEKPSADFSSEQDIAMKLRMLRFRCCTRARAGDVSLSRTPKRRVTTSTSAQPSKPTGDISSVFPSLSGIQSLPLPSRFADLKRWLIKDHEDHVRDSWHRLLLDLGREIDVIKALGSKVIPELEFRDMHNMEKRTTFRDGLRNRGVGLIRGVVSKREALDWKELVKRYIQTNPSTKGR